MLKIYPISLNLKKNQEKHESARDNQKTFIKFKLAALCGNSVLIWAYKFCKFQMHCLLKKHITIT